MNSTAKKPAAETVAITRRHMLMRLGLAATAAYVAPTLLQLSEARAASNISGPSKDGRLRKGVRRNGSFTGPSDGRRRRTQKWVGPSDGRGRVGVRGKDGRPSFSR